MAARWNVGEPAARDRGVNAENRHELPPECIRVHNWLRTLSTPGKDEMRDSTCSAWLASEEVTAT